MTGKKKTVILLGGPSAFHGNRHNVDANRNIIDLEDELAAAASVYINPGPARIHDPKQKVHRYIKVDFKSKTANLPEVFLHNGIPPSPHNIGDMLNAIDEKKKLFDALLLGGPLHGEVLENIPEGMASLSGAAFGIPETGDLDYIRLHKKYPLFELGRYPHMKTYSIFLHSSTNPDNSVKIARLLKELRAIC